MKIPGKITIPCKIGPGFLLGMLVLLPFLFGALQQLLGLPGSIRYLLDIVWVTLTLLILKHRPDFGAAAGIGCWVLLFFLFTGAVYPARYQSGLYYLWGFRNNFRFYAAFLAFALFLKPREAKNWLTLFDKLFWLDIAVSLVQFFFLGLSGDHLGGLFGTQKGCNGDTNIFFLIIAAKSLVCCTQGQERFSLCAAKCAAALLVAALAELKFFFAEFALVAVLIACFGSLNRKKLVLLLLCLLGTIAGAGLLTYLFPSFGDWFSFKWLWDTAISPKGYTSAGDINRLTAISGANEWFLTTWDQQLLGLGLGNCDTSAYTFLNTPFFKQYGHLHYTWLSTAFVYVEMGYLGLVFYFGFFALVYLAARRGERRDAENLMFYRLARILAVCCPVIAVYNSSLRTEGAYLAYFILSLPYVMGRKGGRTIAEST